MSNLNTSILENNNIKKYYWNHPNILNIKELLTCENVKIIQNLSVYISKRFKLREDML